MVQDAEICHYLKFTGLIMQRPFGIQLATLLMVCALVMNQTIAFTFTPEGLPFPTSALPKGQLIIGSLILNLIAAAFVVAFWNGMNWVRWLVIIDSVYKIVSLINLPNLWNWSPSMAVFEIYEAALGVFLLVYLSLRSTHIWFTERTRINRANSAFRKQNQP